MQNTNTKSNKKKKTRKKSSDNTNRYNINGCTIEDVHKNFQTQSKRNNGISTNNLDKRTCDNYYDMEDEVSDKAMLLKFQTDFIFRLFFRPVCIIMQMKYASEGRFIKIGCLSDEVNQKQYMLFKNFLKLIIESMCIQKPKSKQSKNQTTTTTTSSSKIIEDVGLKEIKDTQPQIYKVGRELYEQVLYCRSTFLFQFAILRLIHTTPGIKNLVSQMVPKGKMVVLQNLLNNMFICRESKTSGVESQIFTENKFNKIYEIIRLYFWTYPMSIGTFQKYNEQTGKVELIVIQNKILQELEN